MKKRSNNFIPALIAHLLVNAKFSCKLTDLPKSYQSQPYNLSAKLLSRGGIDARVFFNVEHNTFNIVRLTTPTPHENQKRTIPTSRQSALRGNARTRQTRAYHCARTASTGAKPRTSP